MSLTQTIAGSSADPAKIFFPAPGQYVPALDASRIRAGLMLRKQTLRSFAREHGVSHTLVKLIIKGAHPSRTGKSKAIRRELEEIAA